MKYFPWCLLFFACYLQAQSHTVTVDFTNRSGGYAIPGPMAGWNGTNLNFGRTGATVGQQIQDAQLWNQRYFLGVYTTCTASGCGPLSNGKSYDTLDSDLREVFYDVGPKARVTIVINGTPTDLTRGDCSPTNLDVPSDVNKWADLVLQLVQHIDSQSYSGIVEAYEIDNEPDLTGICWPVKYTEQEQLHDYKLIYAAAGSKIHRQINADGKKLGGPAICCSQTAAAWLSTGYAVPPPHPGWELAFLRDPTTAPYVDFVSAHHYGNGATTWAAEFGNEQAISYRNFSNDMFGYIHAGLQKNARSTPLWINEYDSGVGRIPYPAKDACRFAPCNGLFHGIFIADQIAQVYNTNHGMARTWMYAIYKSNHCIFGTATYSSSGCDSTSYVPMPNYYALELINGTIGDGLDLGSGGYAVQHYSTGQPTDTVTAAWYNGTGNNFYIVNAGPNWYTTRFVFKNTSYVKWTGAVSHVWDSENAPTIITNHSIVLTKSNVSDWTTSTITLPPHSILGIRFRGQ